MQHKRSVIWQLYELTRLFSNVSIVSSTGKGKKISLAQKIWIGEKAYQKSFHNKLPRVSASHGARLTRCQNSYGPDIHSGCPEIATEEHTL